MIPFVGGSYELRRKKADTQRAINLFPTRVESGSGKSPMYLASVPGLAVFSGEPPLCPVPVVIFTSSCVPAVGGVTDGSTALLSWTVTGADTVSISGGIGAVSASGTYGVPNAYPFTLTATNACGPTVVSLTTQGHWVNYEGYAGMAIFSNASPEALAQQVGEYVCSVLFPFGGLSTYSFGVGGNPTRGRGMYMLCNNNRVEGPLLIYTECTP